MEQVSDWFKSNIWLILFIVWGVPLGYYRSRFRKIVYRTESWQINIKPFFVKETKALFTTMYPQDRDYIKFRNFYRLYLAVYTALFIAWRWLK